MNRQGVGRWVRLGKRWVSRCGCLTRNSERDGKIDFETETACSDHRYLMKCLAFGIWLKLETRGVCNAEAGQIVLVYFCSVVIRVLIYYSICSVARIQTKQ